MLVSLSLHIQEEAELSSELTDLLEVVDHWANGLENYWSNSSGGQVTGEDGYLGGWFMFFALPWGAAWPQEPRPQSPLHPLWALYRGRMLIWSAVENGFRYQVLSMMWRHSGVHQARRFLHGGFETADRSKGGFPGQSSLTSIFRRRLE